VTIQAVVRDKELPTHSDGVLVAFVRIRDEHRFDLGGKSGRKVFIMLHKAQTVTRNHQMTDGRLLDWSG
jgi:hypothetical protein